MVELWRDDMLEAMLEIDSQLKIKSAGAALGCPLLDFMLSQKPLPSHKLEGAFLCRALLLLAAELDAPYVFGCGAQRLIGQPITSFLHAPGM